MNQMDKITYYGSDEAPRKTWETNANNKLRRYSNGSADGYSPSFYVCGKIW